MAQERTRSRFACQVEKIRERVERKGLAFQSCLSADLVSGVAEQTGVRFRETIYTPWVTLWAFLSQVLGADGSCRFAVDQVIAYRVANGKKPCSPTTSSYCEARARLPESFYGTLVRQTAREATQQTPAAWKCNGRTVKVVDGSTSFLADTAENRAEFPLQDPKRAGLSFPMVRLLVIFSLAVGTAVEYAVTPYRGKGTGELAMLTRLLDTFEPNDILLGDRAFCSYAHAAALVERRVDTVVKLNRSRLPNLKFLRQIGRDDALYRWHKPKEPPETFNAAEFAALPERITVRLIYVRSIPRGFRAKRFWVLTTLCDAKRFSAAQITELFRQRWRCELYLRDIKSTLGMDMLRCETPAMIRREIAAYLTAYNLIRIQMAQAADALGLRPERMSFKGAVQVVLAFRPRCAEMTAEHLAVLLATIGYHQVGKQPGRLEPRRIKRRPSFSYLTAPRARARKQELQKA